MAASGCPSRFASCTGLRGCGRCRCGSWVSGDKRVTEEVVVLGVAGNAGAVLGEQSPAGDRQAGGERYRALTAPALRVPAASSEGAPAARSAMSLLLKSPAVSVAPNSSLPSMAPPTWVNSRPPAVVRPLAEPYRTLTAPASAVPARSSSRAPRPGR